MMVTVKVAALQFAAAGQTRAAVLEEADAGIAAAAAEGARVVLLPELFAWPYFAGHDPAEWRDKAEPLDGMVSRWGAGEAGRYGVALLLPVFLRERDGRRSNAVLLAEPGGEVSVVARKIHLPPTARTRWGEVDHFSAGPPEVPVVPVAGLRVAVLICYDRRFPECWGAARAGGADAVFVPVAGPADEDPDYFIAEMRTHARGCGLWAVSASRTGLDAVGTDRVTHDGDTAIVAPDGRIVACRRQDEGPGLVVADIDLYRLALCRRDIPLFDQRRAVVPAPVRRIP